MINRRHFIRGLSGILVAAPMVVRSPSIMPIYAEPIKTSGFDATITRKMAKLFLEQFEASRVMSKCVNSVWDDVSWKESDSGILTFKRTAWPNQ